MSDASTGGHANPRLYEVRITGHLAPRWAAWFDGLTLTNDADGTTVIRGPVVDQAALHGLLRKLRDTGLPLVSVIEVDPVRTDAPTTPRPPTTQEEQL